MPFTKDALDICGTGGDSSEHLILCQQPVLLFLGKQGIPVATWQQVKMTSNQVQQTFCNLWESTLIRQWKKSRNDIDEFGFGFYVCSAISTLQWKWRC
ncbi:MAG: hypothetical protein CM15mP58_19450 [Burkholderiaceae bacterium]|nr:MAG: hypothetical protein CM15mP58_19450 [Burkholderiaceae bacterium]